MTTGKICEKQKARSSYDDRDRNGRVLLLRSDCWCRGLAAGVIGKELPITGRTEVWDTLLAHAVNPWIGAGYENFWIGQRVELFNRLLGGLNQAHNGYIEIYLNIGFVGLALLGIVIVAGYRNILREMRRDRLAGRLKVAFFVICLIYNFTEASFKMMSPVWFTFLWAVLLVPVPRRANV